MFAACQASQSQARPGLTKKSLSGPGRLLIGNGSTEEASSSLTVYRPSPEKANGAAMVICPGGGYRGLVMQAEGHGIAAWLVKHGITGVVLAYRLPAGRQMVPLLDAQRAIRTVRSHADEWHLDPHRIGIIGFSAGGHLASTAGTHFDSGNPQATDPIDRISCRPDFVVLVYPVITMGEKTHTGSKRNLLGSNPTPEATELFSNEKQVTDQTPPTFLAHAVNDAAVPPENSREFYAALKQHHVPAEYSGAALRRPRAERLQGPDVGRLANRLAPLAGQPGSHSQERCQIAVHSYLLAFPLRTSVSSVVSFFRSRRGRRFTAGEIQRGQDGMARPEK